MPLYEGVGCSEKAAVILDIGSAYTKLGFAGEVNPWSIIPSEVKSSKTGHVTRVYSTNDPDVLYTVLVDFVHVLYFRYLQVNPKDRRVVIVESILCPTVFKETLAKVLFKHYEVPSIYFAPSHLVSLLTVGVSSALVLDCGYTESLALPIYEGIPLLKAWQALPLAGNAIHNYLEAQLMESAMMKTEQSTERPLSSALSTMDPHVLELIKLRCCIVTKLSRAKQIQEARLDKEPDPNKFPTPLPSVEFPLDGGKILCIDGKIREQTCELMFEQDAEQKSVSTLLLDSIMKFVCEPARGPGTMNLCPIDVRRSMTQNILLMGGTCMMPGFKHRLVSELNELKDSPKYAHLNIDSFKFHVTPCADNYTAWLGGAIFGDLEILPSRSVLRDQYQQTGAIPDWCKQHVDDVISRDMKMSPRPAAKKT